MWVWLREHFGQYKLLYGAITAVFTLAGAGAGSIGQQWLTETIDGRVNVRLVQVEDKLDSLQVELSCSRITQEIERRRSEIWALETELVKARDEDNQALVNRLTRRISEVNAALQDELERRRQNRCTVEA